jgi:hypothetical protein
MPTGVQGRSGLEARAVLLKVLPGEGLCVNACLTTRALLMCHGDRRSRLRSISDENTRVFVSSILVLALFALFGSVHGSVRVVSDTRAGVRRPCARRDRRACMPARARPGVGRVRARRRAQAARHHRTTCERKAASRPGRSEPEAPAPPSPVERRFQIDIRYGLRYVYDKVYGAGINTALKRKYGSIK